MTKKFLIDAPAMPETISFNNPGKKKLISYFPNIAFRIDVGDLTEEEAKQYAELMKQTFLLHWKKKRKK